MLAWLAHEKEDLGSVPTKSKPFSMKTCHLIFAQTQKGLNVVIEGWPMAIAGLKPRGNGIMDSALACCAGRPGFNPAKAISDDFSPSQH